MFYLSTSDEDVNIDDDEIAEYESTNDAPTVYVPTRGRDTMTPVDFRAKVDPPQEKVTRKKSKKRQRPASSLQIQENQSPMDLL